MNPKRLAQSFACIVVSVSLVSAGLSQGKPIVAKFEGFKIGSWTDQASRFNAWLSGLHSPSISKFKIDSVEYQVVLVTGGSGLFVCNAAIIEVMRASNGSKGYFLSKSALAHSSASPVIARLSRDKKAIELVESRSLPERIVLRYQP